MKGKVLRSFSDTKHGSFSEGEEIDIPAGVDWVQAGFVAAADEIETAAVQAPERAVKKTAKPRQPRKVKAND